MHRRGGGSERDRRMVGRRKKEEKTSTVDMFEWELLEITQRIYFCSTVTTK
jgi:hypothetical protein